MNAPAKVSGIEDLLGHMFQFKDPHLAESAANNTLVPVGSGLAAIGDLLWVASQADEPIEPNTLGDIGCLIKFLADLSDMMHSAAINAKHQQIEALQGKQGGV